jgi:hypothetical protein
MSTIQSNVNEIKEINLEIKLLQEKIKNLKKRSTELERDILQYLNEKEQPGVKYQNTAIVIENRQKNVMKKKKDANNEMLKFIAEHGISKPEEFLKHLNNIKKENVIEMQKIKIQNYKI